MGGRHLCCMVGQDGRERAGHGIPSAGWLQCSVTPVPFCGGVARCSPSPLRPSRPVSFSGWSHWPSPCPVLRGMSAHILAPSLILPWEQAHSCLASSLLPLHREKLPPVFGGSGGDVMSSPGEPWRPSQASYSIWGIGWADSCEWSHCLVLSDICCQSSPCLAIVIHHSVFHSPTGSCFGESLLAKEVP